MTYSELELRRVMRKRPPPIADYCLVCDRVEADPIMLDVERCGDCGEFLSVRDDEEEDDDE